MTHNLQAEQEIIHFHRGRGGILRAWWRGKKDCTCLLGHVRTRSKHAILTQPQLPRKSNSIQVMELDEKSEDLMDLARGIRHSKRHQLHLCTIICSSEQCLDACQLPVPYICVFLEVGACFTFHHLICSDHRVVLADRSRCELEKYINSSLRFFLSCLLSYPSCLAFVLSQAQLICPNLNIGRLHTLFLSSHPRSVS
jgi:hypothetical protein